MNKRISLLVATGFAILISMGLATNVFLTLAVQRTLQEQQHIEATAIESRAATRSLRADYLEMGSAVGAALLDPALKSKFKEFWAQKQRSDHNTNAHLKKAFEHTRNKELLLLLNQLRTRDARVTEPIEQQLFKLAKVDAPKARRFYVLRYLPDLQKNIKISEAALDVATQDVSDLQENVENGASFAQSIARRAILVFVLLGVASGFFLTRAVAVITRQSEQTAQANRNMLEYSQDVICSIDGAGRFINVSQACQLVWGYSAHELEGRPYQELLHPDDVAKTIQVATDIVGGVAVKDFENRYLCKNGSVVDMLWSAHWSGAEHSMFCVARDITERKEAQEKLRTLAMFDGLTKLMNRTAIMGFLARETERAAREGQSVGIVLLDLDHFKQVNDTYGHAAGDIVLKEAARRMKNSMRAYDEVGRYGGEEFLVVAPGLSGENVLAVAERVRLSIANTPVDIGEKVIQVRCSLGVAVTGDGQKEDIDALIERADSALYRAKENGRNRVELAV